MFAWAFFSVIIQVPLAFLVAFYLVGYRNKVTNSLRAVYYLASILPSAITAMIGRFVFSPRNGIISTVATALKLPIISRIDFLGDPNVAFWTIFIVATWTYTGFYIVYLMARIEQIPMEIREAAELDGASGWRYAWHIVMPIVTYPLRIICVLCIVGSMKVFDLPYMITAGGPGNATVTLGIILYNQGFVNWQYGIASAVGVVICVLPHVHRRAVLPPEKGGSRGMSSPNPHSQPHRGLFRSNQQDPRDRRHRGPGPSGGPCHPAAHHSVLLCFQDPAGVQLQPLGAAQGHPVGQFRPGVEGHPARTRACSIPS